MKSAHPSPEIVAKKIGKNEWLVELPKQPSTECLCGEADCHACAERLAELPELPNRQQEKAADDWEALREGGSNESSSQCPHGLAGQG